MGLYGNHYLTGNPLYSNNYITRGLYGFLLNQLPPCSEQILIWAKTSDENPTAEGLYQDERPDTTERDSVMSKYFNQAGTTYLRFADYPSTSLTYLDHATQLEVVTTTDGDGDFTIPSNGVDYIKIDGHFFVAEEVIDPTDNNQAKVTSTDGEVTAYAFNTTSTWVVDSVQVHPDAIVCDKYGVLVADGATIYRDELLTDLYVIGQPISALEPTPLDFSKTLSKAWIDDGQGVGIHAEIPEETRNTIKHTFHVINSFGVTWNQTNDTYEYIGFDNTMIDFDNVYPYSEFKVCNLADDGTVNAYYGEVGYVEDGSNGQVMTEIPLTYFKYTYDTSGDVKHTWEFSKFEKDGFTVHPAFIKGSGYTDKIYISTYEGSIYDTSVGAYLLNDEQIADFDNDLCCSIANAKPASGLTQNLTIVNSRKLAQNRGSGWQLIHAGATALIQQLMVAEFTNFNSQGNVGLGVVNKASGTGNESENTGQTASLGNGSGYLGTNGLSSVRWRGMENLWGNIWYWVDGINIQANNRLYINVENNNFVSDKFTDEYVYQGDLANTNGYVGEILGTQYGTYCTETNSSSSTRLYDYYYQSSGNRVAPLGARWLDGGSAGVGYWRLNFSSGGRSRFLGFRALYQN